MSTTIKGPVHLGANYTDHLEVYRNTKLGGTLKFVRYHAGVDIGPSIRYSECDND